jgi:hypothetical protein
MLVGALGDLQGVWSSAEEKALLLALLLLSSDLVRVPSEDTVLYTATQYWQAQTRIVHKVAVKAALAPLIRVPQLSTFALYCAAMAAGSSPHLLSSYGQELQRLLFGKTIAQVAPEELISEVATDEDAPGSWGLRAREIRPLLDGVQLNWRVTVEKLNQACMDSFKKQELVTIDSPGSAPMGGVAWRMSIHCRQEDGGTIVGLYLVPIDGDLPAGSFYKLKYTFMWQGVEYNDSTSCLNSWSAWRYEHFFDLQPMAGDGWDEAAWAAAADGMPSTGEMLLQLHVHSVCAT